MPQENLLNSSAVSPRSSKKEILDAYLDLVNKCQNEVVDSKSKEAEKTEIQKEKTVKNVSELVNSENLIKSIGDTKVNINKMLVEIESLLTSKFEEFKNLNEAVSFQKQSLQNLYQVEVNSDTLLSVLKANGEAKDNFGEEMRKEREFWEIQKKNEKDKASRELAEYEYEVKLKKRDFLQKFEEEKRILENDQKQKIEELKQREEFIKSKEAEFLRLQNEVNNFANVIKEKCDMARAAKEAELNKDHQVEIKILKTEMNAEKEMLKSKIISSESVIEEQKQRIEKLNQQVQDASKQVQEIVLKSIDGTASKIALQDVKTIALKQAESVGK